MPKIEKPVKGTQMVVWVPENVKAAIQAIADREQVSMSALAAAMFMQDIDVRAEMKRMEESEGAENSNE